MSKLLLAVSEQWTVDERIDALGLWANRLDAPILVVHVVADMTEAEGQELPGEQTLKQVTARLKKSTPRVESLLLFSNDLVDALLKTAEEHQVTMLVLGLSRQGVIERLIEGNVQRAVLNSSRLPVLALPSDWDGTI
ncbi:MAG TPA: universal stress protein [Phycisphaerae bacterium]|nr:universal stress protein [Phycisphaerae bacterium]